MPKKPTMKPEAPQAPVKDADIKSAPVPTPEPTPEPQEPKHAKKEQEFVTLMHSGHLTVHGVSFPHAVRKRIPRTWTQEQRKALLSPFKVD